MYTYTVGTRLDIPKITYLVGVCFSCAVDRDRVFWKYFGGSEDAESYVYCARDGEKLIGLYVHAPIGMGGQPTLVEIDQCIDMCVHPDYRGQGVLTGLYTRCHDERVGVISCGFSTSQGRHIDMKSRRYGYTCVGDLLQYISFVSPWKKSSESYTGISSSDKTYTLTLLANNFSSTGKYSIGGESYLSWRYTSPEYILLVLHPEKGEQAVAYAFVRQVGRVLYLLKYVGPDGKLHRGVEDYARDRGCWFLHSAGLSSRQDNAWRIPGSEKYRLTVRIGSVSSSGVSEILDAERWECDLGDVL